MAQLQTKNKIQYSVSLRRERWSPHLVDDGLVSVSVLMMIDDFDD